MRIHAVHKLIEHRRNIATKPFKARGAKVERCVHCCIAKQFCICEYQPDIDTELAVLLLMSDNEVLKPSNTGRLIADTVKQTFCYQWSRTEPEAELLELLSNSEFQPIIVFPEEYVENRSRVIEGADSFRVQGKTPLLIFLDGSWREARRMFRKSPYLDKLPILSIRPEKVSEYVMRNSHNDNHLSTAEVASLVMEQLGEQKAARVLSSWFETFRESYMLSKTRIRQDLTRPALQAYIESAK
ncbi:tRNA-uridine aminocarboxypropyltransferase [Vibrio hannami]|uniref:tRNA-uridine aminocarboxypropyltransferase n=1 Tax=Vibrio hannami TaxID=2717094 RepID=UPI003EBCC3FB